MIKCDCHMHSDFSADSEASMVSMIEKSIDLGLKNICFTDHLDLDFPKEYDLIFEFDIDEYFCELNKFKTYYKDQININIGIELGLMPHLGKRYDDVVNNYDFDFIIASSHLVNGKDPYYPNFWDNTSSKDCYYQYFDSILDNIENFSNFDVYGHLDYIIRYNPDKNDVFSYEQYKEKIDQILKRLITLGKGIEINTAGYKYGLNSPNPSKDIIKRYLELGGNIITVGADGHMPGHIAYGYDKLKNLFKELNVKQYNYFLKRKPISISL